MEADQPQLSWEDTRILRLESAAIMGHTLKLVHVEPVRRADPLTGDALREHVASRLPRVPQATRRIAFPSHRGELPRWVDDPGFDISAHVRERPTSGEGGAAELNAIVAELMSERLDHERPLWRMDLITPLAGGSSAIAFFVHHCMADGITALRLGHELLWDEDPGPASSAPSQSGQTPSGQPSSTPHQSPASSRPGFRLSKLPGTLARELRPGSADPTLGLRIGSRRAVAFAGHPLERIRDVAHGAGAALGTHVTVNDIVIVAVAGGLRGWLGEAGREEHLRAQIPVSMHARSEHPDELGNHDSFLFVDLPVSEPDPLRRVALVNAQTSDRKQRHDADELYAFFHALGRFGALGRAAAKLASGPRSFSLSISNVPGPRNPLRVGDRPVRALHSLSEPADRHALRVAVISAAGSIAFGLCVDPDAVEGVEALGTSITTAVAELEAAALR